MRDPTPAISIPSCRAFPAEDRADIDAALDRAIQGECDFEATFRVRQDDGAIRWVKGIGRLVANSTPKRLVGVSIDVTPEHLLAETRDLMLREMNHRVKNLFAVIAGMVTIAARSHSGVTELRGGYPQPHRGAGPGAFTRLARRHAPGDQLARSRHRDARAL